MKRNNQLKPKYALRKNNLFFSGRHIDKNYVSFIFLAFSKKRHSLIVVLVERGKRSILSCNKIIMRNLYNTNLMPTAKKYYETKLRLFENETLE